MIRSNREKNVFGIDRVRSELVAGDHEEDLVRWVMEDIPQSFFEPVDTSEIVEAYTEIMLWIQHHQSFFDQAKAKFAAGADGWLVAYAIEHNTTDLGVGGRSVPGGRAGFRG